MVVIGGGIIGVATALALAQRGIAVTVCENGVLAGEQSSRNWGWGRKTMRDTREIPLMLESLRLWQGMNATVGAETGFRASGILYASPTEADLAQRQDWLRRAAPYQIGARIVTAAAVDALLPGGSQRFAGGLGPSALG